MKSGVNQAIIAAVDDGGGTGGISFTFTTMAAASFVAGTSLYVHCTKRPDLCMLTSPARGRREVVQKESDVIADNGQRHVVLNLKLATRSRVMYSS
jgi:hypothetical protein